MSERIELILPPKVYKELKRKAEETGLTINDLIIRAIVRIIEEE